MRSIDKPSLPGHSSKSDGWRADPNYHVENFKIINAMTNEEYR
jgi:hypothetical protein